MKYVFGLRPLHLLRLLLELRKLKDGFLFPLYFLCWLKHFQVGVILHSDFTVIENILLFL